ncbi:endonuclease [Subsaxibacter sp. CAU 1640]|uniref:endonuclease n=1 Tax=Subsaxibacter sp. CAU 1640 TaxID=2933271 RepID=UPI00200626F3|nr:endonuclease [Subsaxibacter sp. CAU 1640]MCK7589971.1 endonuclease [Subsaxibacter sp. CAU 1640]
MKQIYLLAALLITATINAQIPAGYYNSATGTGYTLKTQLKNIIDNNNNGLPNEHIATDQGYNALDALYANSDRDIYYENDNTILDLYSENPLGADPYNYIYGSDECGNYNSEGDCYNKEHVIPQSAFNDASPMRNDGHQVIPTDGRVNGFRGNYPYGVVGTLISQSGISNPTMNGSKLGNNLNSGYSAGYTGIVFEPIDEFKGDIARIYFYFVTRYQSQVGAWSSYAMFDGSTDKVLADPFLNILMTWHQMDPVSQREINRNNVVYNYQNNRNPFVDHPEYVQMIWNPNPDTTAPSVPTNLVVTNEASTSISLSWTASTDNIAVTSYDIYVDGNYNSNSTTTTATVGNLTPETTYTFTVVAKDASNNISAPSAPVDGTTTEAGSSGSECASETFTNIDTNSSTYTTVNWTGDNGLQWTATDSRTDQTLSGKAITIRNGVLTAPTIAGGIGTFTVTTKRVFGGSSGTFNLKVNGNVVGTIAYSDQDVTQTITIPNINIENNVTISIDGNSTASNRVVFDDLSWTCYSSLGIDEQSLSSVNIYPNPAKNIVNITLNSDSDTLIEIYNVLGKKVYQKTIQNTDILNLDTLSSGIYIVKLTQENNSISKKLIKN